MKRVPGLSATLAFTTTVAVLVAACGGGGSTPTPVPPTTVRSTPTAAPAPAATATVAPATSTALPPTATQPTATSTAAPRPTPTAAPQPTPTPSGAAPTPVVDTTGKRGGTLQLSILSSYIDTFDTFSTGGKGAVPSHNLLLNNLLWTDPYGDGSLVGDVAKAWAYSSDGKALTFEINKGITFHDGKPLTSKDVAYNIERAWKPRGPRMTEFKGKLDALQKVETPDDYTVRLTLSSPSNYFLVGISISQFLIFPAHIPLPENDAQWKAQGIGSGPFKLKNTIANTRIETVRNDSYWKQGLPYLDGVNLNAIDDGSLVLAGFRAGRLDATSIDYSYVAPGIVNGTLQKEQGFVPHTAIRGGTLLMFNQKPPWTDPRVREAVDLALDRPGILKVSVLDMGSAFPSPLINPEAGGRWGISESEMKTRPGYRPDKTQDIARAKQLLKDAGVDPSSGTTRITVTGGPATVGIATAIEASVRELGFKTQIVIQGTAQAAESRIAGNYELTVETLNPQVDDPLDYLAIYTKTGAAYNFAKWSDPTLDKLYDEQDKELDISKRRQMLRDIQERVLADRHELNVHFSYTFVGGNGYVKNYPPKLPFTFDSRFRWEQVWLDRPK